MGMVTLFNIFPPVFRKGIIVFSAGLSAILFILVDYFMIRSVYDELTIFHATSGALGIPVWIYYIGVPIFSVFVFMGIYKDAVSRLEDNKGLPNK
jgi:TRAP-type C4-dicarboxylate transport system permease small subunit